MKKEWNIYVGQFQVLIKLMNLISCESCAPYFTVKSRVSSLLHLFYHDETENITQYYYHWPRIFEKNAMKMSFYHSLRFSSCLHFATVKKQHHFMQWHFVRVPWLLFFFLRCEISLSNLPFLPACRTDMRTTAILYQCINVSNDRTNEEQNKKQL